MEEDKNCPNLVEQIIEDFRKEIEGKPDMRGANLMLSAADNSPDSVKSLVNNIVLSSFELTGNKITKDCKLR